MTEGQLVVFVSAAWAGAILGVPVPLIAAMCGAVIVLVYQRPVLLIGGVFVLASSLSARADAAYRPSTTGEFAGVVRLTIDPEPGLFGWSAEARLADGSRVRLVADRSVDISGFVAGEQVQLSGRLRPIEDAPWLRTRHIVGQIAIDSAHRSSGVVWWMRPAEALRSWVRQGSQSFADDDSALYAGLVIGDDRFQSDSQRALFRAGGLTHLLAVSGQNVAFALAVVGPLLRRLRLQWRFALTVAVLVVFAMATRFEPSVLRATVTAGIAAWAVMSGRRASGIRVMCLAVTALIMIDPFLVDSVGFRLSVGASAAILLLGPLLRDRLPGPAFVREPLAVTLAAQVGVAPIMVATFGPVSLSTIPANLLAGPAAGAVMTWGLSVGVVAAWLPDAWAVVVQWPAMLMVQWIGGVAGWASRLPLPLFDGVTLVLTGALGVSVWAASMLGRVGWLLRVGLVGVALASWLGAVPLAPHAAAEYGSLSYYPSEDDGPSVLVVNGTPRVDDLESLIANRVTGVDVVVTRSGGYTARQSMMMVRETIAVATVLAPPLHQIRGAEGVDAVVEFTVVGGTVRVEPGTDREHLTITFEASAKSS